MITTRTTFIIGAGAASELAMPTNDELLLKIGQSLEFSRLGTPTQSRDTALLAHYFTALATARGHDQATAFKAAERLRLAARLARSVDAVLDQHDADPLVVACGKLTLIHFMCQAEAKSILRLTPRVSGDLPIQGTESWLYQFGQLVTNGVPLSRVDSCLDAVSVISFCYDRSVEHFMPHALMMAFGMPFDEAQQLVSERLRIVHPYGTLGRLPWQSGSNAVLEWGVEMPGDVLSLVPGIRTGTQTMADAALIAAMQAVVADSQRLVMLGFGYSPLNLEMLAAQPLPAATEVLATTFGLNDSAVAAVRRILGRRLGERDGDGLLLANLRANDLMRDYALLLES